MRKIISILLLFYAISSSSQNFAGGIVGGTATTQVSGDGLGGFHKAGIYLGVFTEYPLSNITNVKMEMNYIQKGSNNPEMNKEYERGLEVRPDISLSYLEVPISINYHQNEKMSFEAGVQTAFLISAKDNYWGRSYSSDDPDNPHGSFYKNDIGAFIGMSYSLGNKNNLNTRIGNSLFPIRPHSGGATYKLNRGQYNLVLSFTIQYYLI